MRTLVAVAALLALAGCGGEDDKPAVLEYWACKCRWAADGASSVRESGIACWDSNPASSLAWRSEQAEIRSAPPGATGPYHDWECSCGPAIGLDCGCDFQGAGGMEYRPTDPYFEKPTNLCMLPRDF